MHARCPLLSLFIALLAVTPTSTIPTHVLRAPHHTTHARVVAANNSVKKASSPDDGSLFFALFPVSQNASKS